jgi:hypothetical protein
MNRRAYSRSPIVPDLARTVVIGTSCAGKTTFAKRLAGALGIRHIELDQLHWETNWTPRARFKETVTETIAGDGWVVDGDYEGVRNLIWTRATALVWLNYGFCRVFPRAIVRTVRRIISREELFDGNRETFRAAFLSLSGIPYWVIRTHWRRRRQYAQLFTLPDCSHLQVIKLARPREAAAFLSGITQPADSPFHV